jgi:hypothetical protein
MLDSFFLFLLALDKSLDMSANRWKFPCAIMHESPVNPDAHGSILEELPILDSLIPQQPGRINKRTAAEKWIKE